MVPPMETNTSLFITDHTGKRTLVEDFPYITVFIPDNC